VLGKPPLSAFLSPVDLSGGYITCEWVDTGQGPWEGRFAKATLKYAQWLIRLAE
jgi:hypothetical protein